MREFPFLIYSLMSLDVYFLFVLSFLSDELLSLGFNFSLLIVGRPKGLKALNGMAGTIYLSLIFYYVRALSNYVNQNDT